MRLEARWAREWSLFLGCALRINISKRRRGPAVSWRKNSTAHERTCPVAYTRVRRGLPNRHIAACSTRAASPTLSQHPSDIGERLQHVPAEVSLAIVLTAFGIAVLAVVVAFVYTRCLRRG